MKEAVEIMPEMLEYGIINAKVLPFLKNVLCQVSLCTREGVSAFCKVQAVWFVDSTHRVQRLFRPRCRQGPDGRAASGTGWISVL